MAERSQSVKSTLLSKTLTHKHMPSQPSSTVPPQPPTQVPVLPQTNDFRRRLSSTSSGSLMTSSLSPVSKIAIKPNDVVAVKPKASARIPSSCSPPANSSTSPPVLPIQAMTKPNSRPPAIAMKGSAIDNIPQLTASKVWVLPPRPKPGRKPSTDTPATKRKAQNRAAQRAFRERRAARVVELEEMLNDVQAERDLREKQLSDTLQNVSAENNELRQSLEELRNEMKIMRQQQQLQFQQMQTQQPIIRQQLDRTTSAASSQVSTPVESTMSPYNSAISPRTTAGTSINSLSSYNLQKSYSAHHKPKPSQQRNFHSSSISSGYGGTPPASGVAGYPPAMDQMASPAPSVESPLDVLDHLLEMRLPVPNKPIGVSSSSASNSNSGSKKELDAIINDTSLSTNSIANMTNSIANNIPPMEEDSDESSEEYGCGVCVKEDCICESLGIRQPKTKSNRSTPAATPNASSLDVVSAQKVSLPAIIKTVTSAQVSVGQSVPIKRKSNIKSSDNDKLFFKKLKRNVDTANTADVKKQQDEKEGEEACMEIDFTTMFAKPKPLKKKKTAKREEPSASLIPDENSIFISMFNDSSHSAGTPVDKCGFCSDGTPCLCAENASQEANSMAEFNEDNSILPPISFSSVNTSTDPLSLVSAPSRRPSSLTFPNSRHNSTSMDERIKLPSILDNLTNENMGPLSKPTTPTSGCTGNPGTCSQCRADPMSTLFCTTLATRVSTGSTRVSSTQSSLSKEYSSATVSKPSGGCCGGKDKTGGGCCSGKREENTGDSKPDAFSQFLNSESGESSGSMPLSGISTSSTHIDQFNSQSNNNSTTNSNGSSANCGTQNSNNNSTTGAGTYIPCSAAYQTLSRHKDFKRVDLGKLVGKLTTRGMQVEVASVANVLRELDRRLYE